MKYLEKYTGTKTYMFPNGALATPQTVLAQFPAASSFVHIVETDALGEVMFAFQNLSAMRTLHGISAELNEVQAIEAVQTAINFVPIYDPIPEERIAAQMEYQNLITLEDVVV